LQEVNVQLEEARRAAEMAKHWRGVFLANMSHELRTPLNAIIGFSDTMLNFPIMYGGVDLPEEYQADLNQIHTSGNHLLKIINDILDLSKIDAGRLELENQPVDLMPIFDGVLNTAVGLIGGKPVQLKRALPPQMPLVWGDPLRIRQVIINLYSNAAKFTDEGEIVLGLEDRGSHVVISVRDTGPGIDEDSLETIFEAFKQGTSGRKQQRKGTGLGLAISRELLGLLNGQIWAESQVGVGSTFYMTLPVYDPAIHSTSENIAETAH
jgi:signal transduction histidine kinase